MPLSSLFFSLEPNTFFSIFFFLTIALLAIGTYTDFKQRIISNKLTYSMIILGILLHGIQSYLLNNYSIILIVLGVVITTFILSYGLWKLGVWAGGDVKAFTAIAALNPINYAFLKNFLGINLSIFSTIDLPIFPLTLFIFSIFSMLPYGAIIAIHGLQKRKKLRQKTIADFKPKTIQSIKISAGIVGISQLLLLIGITQLLVLPIILILNFIKGKTQTGIFGGLFLFGLYFGQINAIIQFGILLILFIIIYGLIKLFSLSKSEILKKEIEVEKLEEGMIPAHSYYEKNGEIVKFEGIQMKRLINYIRNNNLESLKQYLQPEGKEIISNKKAAGLEKEEIKTIKKLAKEGKIEEKITVKLTAPLIPAVFIAFIILSLIGDMIWNILF